MANLSETRLFFYTESVKEFKKSYMDYQKANLIKSGIQDVEGVQAPTWSVKTEEAIGVFRKLEEMIHSACMINEEKREIKLEKSEARFFSGLRHIDNLIKHSDNCDLQISEFIKSVPKISGRVYSNTLKTRMEMIFIFGDIKKIKPPIENKKEIEIFMNQRKNYNGNIRDENVLDVVDKLNSLVNKYYFPK